MRAAIVLAAGASRRFGHANKLLARYRGRPLLHHALAAAAAAPVGRILVVAGADRARIGRAVRAFGDPRAVTVFAQRHRDGRRASLAAGLAALRRSEREVFVFLGDVPAPPPGLAQRLLRCRAAGQAVRPMAGGVPGHPVLLRDPVAACERLAAGLPAFDPATDAAVTAGRGAMRDVDRPGDLRRG